MSSHSRPKRHRESESGQSERTEAVRKLHQGPAGPQDQGGHKDQPGSPGKAHGSEHSSRKGEDVG